MQTVMIFECLRPVSSDFAVFSVFPYLVSKITAAFAIWLLSLLVIPLLLTIEDFSESFTESELDMYAIIVIKYLSDT